jgi:predicted nucleotidyltransferase
MAYGTALVDLPIEEAIRGQRVMTAFVYGSLATPGGGTRSSDLDLLLVGDIKDRGRLMDGLVAVGSRLSRNIDPFILTPEQFDRAKRRRDQHVASALAGVRLFGAP